MQKIVFLLSGILLVFSPIVPQHNNNNSPLTLHSAIDLALKSNPRIRAAELVWRSQLETIPQERALPDPQLSFALFGQSIETRLGPQISRFSLSQKFPFFGKLKTKEKIAESHASALQEQFIKMKEDVVLQVKEAFFTLSWYTESIRITRQEKEVLETLARTAVKHYETGRGSQQDILKVQLEISRSINKLLQLKQGKNAATAKLNSLLNLSPENKLDPVLFGQSPPLDVGLPELYIWAEKERPELKIAERVMQKNEIQLTLAKKNYYPDFNLKFDYIMIGGGSTLHTRDGQNAWIGSIGINIPLWRKKLHAGKAQAQVRLNASRANYHSIRNNTKAMINELYLEIKTLEEQAGLFRKTLLPQAEQSVKASEIGYIAGKVDFLNVLDSERTILQLKTGYQKLITDREKSIARLERIVGRALGLDK